MLKSVQCSLQGKVLALGSLHTHTETHTCVNRYVCVFICIFPCLEKAVYFDFLYFQRVLLCKIMFVIGNRMNWQKNLSCEDFSFLYASDVFDID